MNAQDMSKALNVLSQKVEKLQEQIGKKTEPTEKPKTKPVKAKAPKKAPAKKIVPKKTAPATAIDIVFAIINRSKKGVDVSTLMKKTGFSEKQIHNNVYKLKKQGSVSVSY